MTWTDDAMPAAENTARTNDRPWLMGSHAGDGCTPRWNQTGDASDADESDPDAPAALAVDRLGERQTYPSTSGTDWYLHLGQLGGLVRAEPLTAGLSIIDTLVLWNHNLEDVTAVLEGAETADFGTGYVEIHSFTVTQAGRWVDRFDRRWTADRGDYLRLHLSSSTAFTPRVGELWIGRRRQLRGHDTTGRDPYAVASDLASSESAAAGVEVRARALGRVETPVAIQLLETSTSLSDIDTVRRWWRECGCGTRPFVWQRAPTSDQHDARVMTTEARRLDLPQREALGVRVLEQTWRELPPYRVTET